MKEQLSQEMIAEKFTQMQQEDAWLISPNGLLLHGLVGCGGINPFPLEHILEITELDTIEYPQSAALYTFLASQYMLMETELTYDEKKTIELEKLNKIGLDQAYGKPISEISHLLPNDGKGINAANAILELMIAERYVNSSNKQRCYGNLIKALENSGNHNQTIYENLVDPTARIITAGFILNYISLKDRVGKSPLYQLETVGMILNSKLTEAKQRVHTQ